MNSPRARNIFIYALVIIAIMVILFQFRSPSTASETASISEIATFIKNGQVKEIVVDGENLIVTLNRDKIVTSRKEPTSTAPEQLLALGVTREELSAVAVSIKPPSDWNAVLTLVGYMLPALLVVGVIFFMLRQAQGTNNQALSFGRSRARMFSGDHPTVTFDDVAGADEAKEIGRASCRERV